MGRRSSKDLSRYQDAVLLRGRQPNPFPEILGGDSQKQIKALRDHLFISVGGFKRATRSGAVTK
jgi:hypothetical protein